ncbi:RsiV family protein [Chryseobacterium sp.]|uniref:RsiV family protein n=1 Tax=Chryseobacterium sp. TaxID=1871047 RepID=UPI0025C38A56|nr:RsiV family protein [Chryseobacterium sp.]
MKNAITILVFTSLIFSSACKKNENKPEETTKDPIEVQQPEKFVIDSVIMNDSTKILKGLTVKYYSKLLVFPTLKDQKLLDSIYSQYKGVKDFSKEGLKSYLEKDKKNYFNSLAKDLEGLTDEESERFSNQEWYSSSSMEVVSNISDYMHIQYSGGGYEGGAHDNYGFSERVFDLKNNKRLALQDITSMAKKDLEEKLMKNIDKIHGGATDSDGDIKNTDMLLVEVIPVTNNFYFDSKNLYFHYSPYEIAAFAAGDIIIPISWEELGGTLNPEFKKRMKIK